MSKSNAFETAILNLILKNTALANIGDAGGLQPSATAGNLYIGLHTADPGEAGDQTTSEATYTGYARIPAARSGTGWAVASGVGSNAALAQFGLCTAGTNAITHFSVGTAPSGAGVLLFSGALSGGGLAVSAGIQPQFAIGALTITEE